MPTPRRTLAALLLAALPALARTPGYRVPDPAVAALITAPAAPLYVASPDGRYVLVVDSDAYPPLSVIARPYVGLAGERIDTGWSAARRAMTVKQYTAIRVVETATGKSTPVKLPAGAGVGVPVWSPDGNRFAFTEDADGGLKLWTADAATADAQADPFTRVTDVLDTPFEWMSDSRHLLARAIPDGRGPAPAAPPPVPSAKTTGGRRASTPTFPDLLASPADEALLDHYCTVQLSIVDDFTPGVKEYARPVGPAAVYTAARLSPDEKHLLVTRLQRPYSYRTRAASFPRVTEVLDVKTGRVVRTLADRKEADALVSGAVVAGPRAVEWDDAQPATLFWAEAQDTADPDKDYAVRDKVFTQAAPFTDAPKSAFELKYRLALLSFTGRPGEVMATEYDRDTRWQTTRLYDLSRPDAAPRVLFDRSSNDAYNDPGTPLYTYANGRRAMRRDGDAVYLAGDGSTPAGDRPFLDKMNLATGDTTRLFQSPAGMVERYTTFVGDDKTTILTNYQTRTTPPNVRAVTLGPPGEALTAQASAIGVPPPVDMAKRLPASAPTTAGAKRARPPGRLLPPKRPATRPAAAGEATVVRTLTDSRDPHPQLTTARRERLTYTRADGVPLSATLYLPPGYDRSSGEKLPMVISAYPREFADSGTAGQIRGSTDRFTRVAGNSALVYLTQGYAVMLDATMPVLGSPKTMNDTYVRQITAGAKAAIDKAASRGVVDPHRVLVTGHSYGAFMTANLLAHSDLFAAGVATSGAYNRTLTPFGFQAEPRTFWEAPETYMSMSPFAVADKINEPLLLVHGVNDNNTGTFPVQSERLFAAIDGTGGTAKLVMLPFESHWYQARESVLHVLAEQFEWADRYVKNRPTTRPLIPSPGTPGEG